jgi:hypothetical protein
MDSKELFNAMFDLYTLPDLYKFFYYMCDVIWTYPVGVYSVIAKNKKVKEEMEKSKSLGLKGDKEKIRQFVISKIIDLQMANKEKSEEKKTIKKKKSKSKKKSNVVKE